MPAANIDPQWAWSTYQPNPQSPWDIRKAAHLHRRAGFGANWATLQKALDQGPAKAVDALVNPADAAAPDTPIGAPRAAAPPAPPPAAFERRMARMSQAMVATGEPKRLSASWLYRMLSTPDPLLEKLTLFWHGHFATSAAKVQDPKMMLDQNRLLRTHAKGRFEDMVQAISKDPAMLIWLDSVSNRRSRPNENYARELMELFCLGLGAYTEDDIKEVARAFTGYEIVQKRFRFNEGHHDPGVKRFLGQSGRFKGEDAVRIVLQQPAASRFIASKLVRFFVMEEPAPTAELIEPLAAQLRENGFVIGPVVERILASNLFFSDHAIAAKVRSPVELGVGLLRSLQANADLFQLAEGLDQLGQAVYFPPNVKGWDGGRTWINAASLLARANLVHHLMFSGNAKLRFDAGGLAELAARYNKTSPQAAVDWLCDLILPVSLPAQARQSLVTLASAADREQALRTTVHAIATLPEFQLA